MAKPVNMYRRGEIWYTAIPDGCGGRDRRSTGLKDQKAAQRYTDQIALQYREQVKSGKTLADAILLWLDHRPRSNRDECLVRRIRREYQDRPLTSVTPQSVRDAFATAVPGTYNRLISIVRSSLKLAEKAGYLSRAPTLPDKPGATQRLVYLRDQDEWLRLRAQLPPHQQDMAEFALATGLRLSNVLNLQWHQVQMGTRLASIEANQMKSRKALAVPLNDLALAVLRRRIGTHLTHVFTYQGEPISNVCATFKSAAERAGLPGVTFHTLRHTWASWHAMAGTPLPVLQQLGGWSSFLMVQRYAHLSVPHVQQWAANFAPPPSQNTTQGRPTVNQENGK